MRGVVPKVKKQMGLKKKMNRLLFSTMIPMACLLVILLLIFWQYAGQYNKLSENLAVSSKFNLSFKDELDLEMYYLAIGSKEASELDDVLGQVEDAQNIMEKLRQNTYHASGVKCLNSLDAYLDNLKKRMVQLMEIKEYDRRMEFMDSNIRIITGLIMQEMQNYIYNESMYLVQVETSLTHRVKILISGMAVLLLATLGILMRRSFRLTGGIIRPVTEMLDKVKKVGRGNFDVLPVSAEIVEIEELDQGINKMAHRISGLLENVRQEKEMQHLTELQLIQAQVNPHFLYNTLDSLYWQAMEQDNEEIAESILALSQLFRLVLSQGKREVTVGQETELVSRYLQIQQMRFSRRLQYEVTVEDAVKQEKIPKLILQPFVENAIVHGFENVSTCCKVTVTAAQRKNRMHFEITDTGIGMSQSQIDEIWEEEPDAYRKQRIGRYAIKNIRERLERRYKEDFILEIKSEVGKGTTVILELPCEEK